MEIDPILLKIRALDSDEQRLITEASVQGDQELEEIIRLTKKFYTDMGIVVSEKLINTVIEIYGKGPSIALARKLKKNPTHFIGQIFKAMGFDAAAMAHKVNSEANQANDPAVMKAILAVLGQIESSSSGTRSAAELNSTDTYAILKQIELMRGENKELADFLKEFIMNNFKKTKGEDVKTGYDSMDLTNKQITFIHNSPSKVYKGTVLVDSDNGLISQEYLDALNKDKNPPIINKTKEELEDIKGQLWVQVQNQVMVINKTAVITEKEAGALSTFIKNAPEDTRSLFDKPLVFFSPIIDKASAKRGNKLVRGLAKDKGNLDYYNKKHDDIMRSAGMSAVKSNLRGDQTSGDWHTLLQSGEYDNPIVSVLVWISNNTSDSGIEISAKKLLVTNAHNGPQEISSKYFKVNLKPYAREKDISNINSMSVFGVDKEQLLIYCKGKNIQAEDKGEEVFITNNF